MRIGIFTHSTIPRGGVVHAVELADTLSRLGHETSVIAPAANGRPFFRDGPAGRIVIDVERGRDLADEVGRRIDRVTEFFEADDAPAFDVWHAQDPISANALARLVDRRRIAAFVRTVHHIDRHDDARLDAWQRNAVLRASRVFCVSDLWRRTLHAAHGIEAAVIGNGVDCRRFSAEPAGRDAAVAERLGLASPGRPVFLSIGGIEHRKNSLAILDAFLAVRAGRPGARLLIAGGASLLDHRDAVGAFERRLAASGAAEAVIRAGVVPDEDMPSLYRLADALVCPSRAEGFGLCPLEAMATGRPAIVSAIPPFTEHFAPDDCLWADPDDVGSIARAMHLAVTPEADRLRARGPAIAGRFDWTSLARRQLSLYGSEDRHARGAFHDPLAGR